MSEEPVRDRLKLSRPKPALELATIFVGCIVVWVVAGKFDILEHFVEFSRQHESWELDELLAVAVFLVIAGTIFSYRRWIESKTTEKQLQDRNIKLQKALAEISQLKGIIPICAGCKKVRDDEGFWRQVEEYISEHSEAEFSHGLCPDCMVSLYSQKTKDE